MNARRFVPRASVKDRGWTARKIASRIDRPRYTAATHGRLEVISIQKRDGSRMYQVELMKLVAGFGAITGGALSLIGAIAGLALNLDTAPSVSVWFGFFGAHAGMWLACRRRLRKLDREIPWTECGPLD